MTTISIILSLSVKEDTKIRPKGVPKIQAEIDISECESLEEVKKYMNAYIFEYNNNRPQWNRKKMTPVQYRNHLLNN